MLACVLGIVRSLGIPCEVSVEAMMACGVGACLGCAVENRREPGRYLHACLHGPVFDASLLGGDFR
jgi:dihydroorotate dehydrogenase electron transfer subunit